MTYGEKSGILTKLSRRAPVSENKNERKSGKNGTKRQEMIRFPKKPEKPRKKFLTKLLECGKLKKLLTMHNGSDVKKLLKKVLDKRNEIEYNSNVPPGTACTL